MLMARDRRDAWTLDLIEYLEQLKLRVAEQPRKAFTLFETKSGPITEDEIDQICELAEQGLKAWSIARRLCRHPSSISWQMWRLGLKPLGAKKEPFFRGGKVVMPFSEAEDRFMVEHRIAGHTPVAIARMMIEQFPHKRSRDTVANRLMMLASDDAVRDVA